MLIEAPKVSDEDPCFRCYVYDSIYLTQLKRKIMQKKAVLVRMKPDLHNKLLAYAESKDRSMTEIIKDLIEKLPDLRSAQP